MMKIGGLMARFGPDAAVYILAVKAIAASSTAALAFDADDVLGKFARRMRADAARQPLSPHKGPGVSCPSSRVAPNQRDHLEDEQ